MLFTMKVVGHVLIWIGSLTFAIIPWVHRGSIIEKYRFESDYPTSPLSDYKCHVLKWGEWSECRTNDEGDITKRRELFGPCLKKKYFDEAPCICSVNDCPSIELFENLSTENCTWADEEVCTAITGTSVE
ncbi:unnamed protein product [Cylicocyclus nassatus]|uniref:Uncharacterized protein n=1 Tax=Cylicocyclus nassatus TaxID=53992 RepID=A0AA36H2N7_CYLNA|nr:unnamed protein product [Cylicocyclus nassatus]